MFRLTLISADAVSGRLDRLVMQMHMCIGFDWLRAGESYNSHGSPQNLIFQDAPHCARYFRLMELNILSDASLDLVFSDWYVLHKYQHLLFATSM